MKKNLRKALPLLALFPALLILSNCAGYQLGSVKPAAYKEVNRIFIPTFENQTLEPRASAVVTNAVIKRLQADGTFAVSTKESADAVLVGKIKRIERRQLRAARTNTLKTTELNSSTSLRNRPGRVIGRTIQFVDPNFQLSERNAIPVAAEDAANILVSQLAEGW